MERYYQPLTVNWGALLNVALIAIIIAITIAVLIRDLKVMMWDESKWGSYGSKLTFREFVEMEEYKLYHIIVAITFVPAWIIEIVAYGIGKAVYSLFNIRIYRKGPDQ